MKFEINPSQVTSLQKDMISRDLTGDGYRAVPTEVKDFVERAKQPTTQEQPVQQNAGIFDDIMTQQPTPTQPDPLRIAALKTVDFEGRKDKQGNLAIYKLPSGDMGGEYEVAGINDKYHPQAFKNISSLPAQERAGAAADYISTYTAPLVSKLPSTIQPFVQDMAFNRGMGGATKYLQQGLNSLGLNVSVDGAMGPKTLSAINSVQPRALMQAASDAQLQDEYRNAERNPNRKKFIPGLESRIRNRLATFS